MNRPAAPALLILALLVGMTGCGGGEQTNTTAGELRDECVAARDEVKVAHGAGDVERAEAAAERATRALASLLVLAAETDADEGDGVAHAREEATEAEREARHLARLTREEAERTKTLERWKVRAYRSARNLGLSATWTALAAAADQAERTDVAMLPEGVRESADLAADLAVQLTGREPLPDGTTDWTGVASDLRTFREETPVDLGLALAVTHLSSGQWDFALCELDLVDPSRLDTRERRDQYHLLLSLVFVFEGWTQLARSELELISSLEDEEGGPRLAAVHLVSAYLHLREGSYEAADRDLVVAMQLWPDNPALLFLTGERVAADGEYEKAAESFETVAAGTEYENLAVLLSKRARELRDRDPVGSETLLQDQEVLRALVGEYMVKSARESEASARLGELVESAREFLEKLLEGVPLPGRPASEPAVGGT